MLTVNRYTRTSAGQNRFIKKCACLGHDSFHHADTPGLDKLHKLEGCDKRSWYKQMIQRNLLTKRQKYVCEACMKHAIDNFLPPSLTRTSFNQSFNQSSFNESDDDSDRDLMEVDDDSDTNVNDLEVDDDPNDPNGLEIDADPNDLAARVRGLREALSRIVYDELSENTRTELIQLASQMGRMIQPNVYADGVVSSAIYKDQEALRNTDHATWAADQNPVLVKFLASSAGVDVNDPNTNVKKIHAIVHAIEQVQYARNLRTITPFSFKRNLISYSMTHSKQITKLTGITEPAGSYTTVHNYLSSPSPIISPKCDQDHSLHVTFDNNQKVGHTSGRIKENSTVPVSVCTSTTYIEPSNPSNIQQNHTNDSWLDWSAINVAAVEQLEERALNDFRSYRKDYIEEVLSQVSMDQDLSSHNVKDHIDLELLHHDDGLSVCAKCKYVYTNEAENDVCPRCRVGINICPSDRYFRTPSQHPHTPPTIQIGEPCMVNPNSVANTKEVLTHIKQQCHIPRDRKWVVVWSDGVPYLYMCKLLDRLYVCSVCRQEIDIRSVSMAEHIDVEHPAVEITERESTGTRLFSYVLPMPGPGHIELNMAKALLSLMWTPILSHFVKQLGFRTSHAQDVVRNGVDHHRSRQILEVALQAISAELLIPYIRDCISHNIRPSFSGYFAWIETNVNDPVYNFLFDICFTYLLAFKLYNEATRKNNSDRMMAARVAFAPIFTGRNHPKYRELHLRDLVLRTQLPDDMAQHIKENEAFSVSGDAAKGQGADFIQEEKNRVIKSFLPPGMPTEEIWRNISRKADDLLLMKSDYLQSVNCPDADNSAYASKVLQQREVNCMRRDLRTYVADPTSHRTPTSIQGAPLDGDMADLKDLCVTNYRDYMNHVAANGFESRLKLKLVYITPAEREKRESIQGKTKAEIQTEIEKVVECLPDPSEVMNGRTASSYLKGKHHDVHVQTYYDVCAALTEQLPYVIDETLDGDIV